MERISYFVPGELSWEEHLIPRLRWPIPAGVARTYVEAYTDPGEVVLVPFSQGPSAVREILAAGRRVVAANFDPALMLMVQTLLAAPPIRELDAAVARLGDSSKQGMPLRHYLAELYTSTCPACQRSAVVDYFIWDREQGAPVAKRLRCPACAWDGRTVVDEEDRQRLDEVPSQGMHYHYVLDRIAPQPGAEALRPRLEFLLELYTPRNLYALAELTLKIESLFPEGPVRRALKVLLLDCLERCSSLSSLPGSKRRQRGLARPGRFLERNVWRAFEEAVGRLQASAGKPVDGLVDRLDAFRGVGEQAGFVGQGLVRDLIRSLSPRSIRLILSSPPPLDSAVWSLSYLWGAWLLGVEAVAPLRPLLRQRTPDPAWYARVMAGSLGSLTDLLQDDGRLVLILTDQRPVLVQALALAAGSARMGVASLVQSGADYRLELMPSLAQAVLHSEEPLDLAIRRSALATVVETIQERGEPVHWRTLHTAMLQRLATQGLLIRVLEEKEESASPLDRVAEQLEAALEDQALVRLVDREQGRQLWWLARPEGMSIPLCDRVEDVAYQVLQDTLALTEADFAASVYARFPGNLAPEAELVATCLRAYGQESTADYWQLRAEDLPQARQAEWQAVIGHLLSLGQKLGYHATPGDPFDVAWFRGGKMRAAFVVHWRAAVDEALALSDRAGQAQPYLVIPGGRAALVSYKLAHNPLLQQVVDASGWRFIKYRHVRQLLSQSEVDEYALRTIIGLDPIVERESAQIPLF